MFMVGSLRPAPGDGRGAHLLLHVAVQPQEFESRGGRWWLPRRRGPRAAWQGLEEEVVVELHQLTAREKDDHLLVFLKLRGHREGKNHHMFLKLG